MQFGRFQAVTATSRYRKVNYDKLFGGVVYKVTLCFFTWILGTSEVNATRPGFANVCPFFTLKRRAGNERLSPI